ncbi:fimbrillin family protein [Parabacteroides timonensis]|uniref:fimbrillin family protein n=1 Tax=Parabacteroides timonensis TaxID=1871013 RepID=UPI00094EE7B5|nr:fimbrillin family protein [Parabacteroides timonensis]
MKRNYLLATISLLAAALLVGGCSQEETTVTDGTTLPEGMYPLTFTAVQTGDGLATRVEENDNGMSSRWSEGDKIKVRIGEGEEGTYMLNANGEATAEEPCYWQNTNEATINAWYSNITGQSTTDKTVSLADQSNGLAYVLKVEQGVTAKYNDENIPLPFKHQLAKVRVKLEGNEENWVDRIIIKGYTSCSITEGTVGGSNGAEGDITMKKVDSSGEYWEACLVPQMNVSDIELIKINGLRKINVSGISSFVAGEAYTITAKLEPIGTKTKDDLTIGFGDYFFYDGTFESHNKKLTDKQKALCIGIVYAVESNKIRVISMNNAAYDHTVGAHRSEAEKLAENYEPVAPANTSGWYLPSVNEWRTIFDLRDQLNALSSVGFTAFTVTSSQYTAHYWASDEGYHDVDLIGNWQDQTNHNNTFTFGVRSILYIPK